jgi:ribosomal protein L6P/L9E
MPPQIPINNKNEENVFISRVEMNIIDKVKEKDRPRKWRSVWAMVSNMIKAVR